MLDFDTVAIAIALERSNAFLIYLGGTLGTLLALWMVHNFRAQRRKIILPEVQLFSCEYCQHNYLEAKDKKVTKCPECASFNEDNPYSP